MGRSPLFIFLAIFFFASWNVNAVGNPYVPNPATDFLIEDYERIPFKDQTATEAWSAEINANYDPDKDWMEDFANLGNQGITYKCLSYATSSVLDWFINQDGGLSAQYTSYVNGESEEGTNPRILESIYHERVTTDSPLYHYILPYIIDPLVRRDPITSEGIPYRLDGYADILIHPPSSYVDVNDYYLSSPGEFVYDLDNDNMVIDDYREVSIDLEGARGADDEENVIYALEHYGAVLAYLENPWDLTGFPPYLGFLNFHSMALVGYGDDANGVYFIAHDNYGGGETTGGNSEYKQVRIEDIGQAFYFIADREWDTFHQNNRRTGFSALKGDLKSSIKQTELSFAGKSETDFWDNPSMANIDSDDEMELIVGTSSDITYGRVFAIDKKKEMWSTVDTLGTDELVVGSTPTTIDISGDGKPETVFGAWNGKLYVLNAKNGHLIDSITVPISTSSIRGMIFGTAVADIDMDGKKEIVFTDFYPSLTWQAKLYVYELDGNKLKKDWDINIGTGSDSSGSQNSPTLANIDGDAQLEIIINTFNKLYAYDPVSKSAQWSITMKTTSGSPVVADVDADGAYEMIVNGYDIGVASCGASPCGNRTAIWSASSGTLQEDYFFSDYMPWGTPAVANLDTDPELEIVVGTNKGTSGKVEVIDVTGSGNTYTYDDSSNLRYITGSPAIADIDISSTGNEILFATDNGSTTGGGSTGAGGTFYVLSKSRSKLWTKSIASGLFGSPAVGDFDGENDAEVMVVHLPLTTGGSSMNFVNYGSEQLPMSGMTFLAPIEGNISNYTTFNWPETYSSATTDAAEVEIIGGLNKKPSLTLSSSEYFVTAGQKVNVTANSTDVNGDITTTIFTAPFNDSGEWTTNTSTIGSFSTSVQSTDGNLTDEEFVTVHVLDPSSTKINSFVSGSGVITFSSANASLKINISKLNEASHARLYLRAPSVVPTTASYQQNGTIVQANIVNMSAAAIVDRNLSTYYSAGSLTGAIVQLENLTIPSSPQHIVFHLRLKVGEEGTGRFGIYDYGNQWFDIVTSSIPATNESYKDIYLDIYSGGQALWITNETHYSYKADSLVNYTNGTRVRWYYRYLNGEYHDQRIYHSEVAFVNASAVPKDISIDFGANGEDIRLAGQLQDTSVILTSFNDSTTAASITLNSTNISKYIRLPKGAQIISAAIKVGNHSITDLNATALFTEASIAAVGSAKNRYSSMGKQFFVDENGTKHNITVTRSLQFTSSGICHDWEAEVDYPESMYIEELRFGPVCADEYDWQYGDVDNDTWDEAYMIKGDTYTVWTYCEAETSYDSGRRVENFGDDDGSPLYGCYDGSCGGLTERNRYSELQSSVSSDIEYPDMYCFVDGAWWGWDDGTISLWYDENENDEEDGGDHFEEFMVLECGDNNDCAASDYCNKHGGTNPLAYTCDEVTCSLTCNPWEESQVVNHACSCVTIPGLCQNVGDIINGSLYCDDNHEYKKIFATVSVAGSFVGRVAYNERVELELAEYLQSQLDACTAIACDIPIVFASAYNISTVVDSLQVEYSLPYIDFVDQLNTQAVSCGQCNYSVNISGTGGTVNASVLAYYVQDPPIAVNLLTPEGNMFVSRNAFFNATAEVCCYNANCGNITVSLDPEETQEVSETHVDVFDEEAQFILEETPEPIPYCSDESCIEEVYNVSTVFTNEWSGKKITQIEIDPDYPCLLTHDGGVTCAAIDTETLDALSNEYDTSQGIPVTDYRKLSYEDTESAVERAAPNEIPVKEFLGYEKSFIDPSIEQHINLDLAKNGVFVIGFASNVFIITDFVIGVQENVTSEPSFSHLQLTTSSPNNAAVLFMPFDVPGSTTYDYTSNNLDGTVSGATNASGKFGTAYNFDGVDDYIQVSDSQNLRLTTGGTIAAWIYPRSFNEGNYPKIVDKGNNSNCGLGGYQFILYNDSVWRNSLQFRTNCNESTQATNNSIMLNQWNFVAVTFNSSGRTIYVNATNRTAIGHLNSERGPDQSWPLRIGNRADQTTQTFDGYIDELAIYNRSLTAAEISALYANSTARFYASGRQTFKSQNITAGVSTVNLSASSYEYEGSDIQCRFGQWDISKGYNNTDTNKIFYYHFDGNTTDSFGTVSSPSLQDSASTSNPGKYDKGLSTDGNGDYLDTNYNTQFATSSWTVSVWAKTKQSDCAYEGRNIFTKGWGYRLYLGTACQVNALTGNASGQDVRHNSFATMQDNVWHHIVYSYNVTENKSRAYFDGILRSTLTQNGIEAETADYHIGGGGFVGEGLNGSVDEVLFMNRTMSDAEIMDLYTKGRLTYTYPATTGISNGTVLLGINNNSTVLLPQCVFVTSYTNNQFHTPNLLNGTPFNLSAQETCTSDPLADTSGNGHVATISGATYNSNGWYEFDGNNDYMNTTFNVNNTLKNGNFTITFWTYSLQDAGDRYFYTADDNGANRFYFRQTGTNNQLLAGLSSWNPTISNTNATAGWTHIAIVLNGTAGAIYRNNVLIASTTGITIDFPSSTLRIGAETGGARVLNGSIDDFRIWNRTLSSAEMTAVYGNGSVTDGLRLHLPFDSCSTASTTKGLISTVPGTTPFYTTSANPTTVNLSTNQCINITWPVNATGAVNTSYSFFAYANLTSNMSVNNQSEIITLIIQ